LTKLGYTTKLSINSNEESKFNLAAYQLGSFPANRASTSRMKHSPIVNYKALHVDLEELQSDSWLSLYISSRTRELIQLIANDWKIPTALGAE
jgi:hypothetical protein